MANGQRMTEAWKPLLLIKYSAKGWGWMRVTHSIESFPENSALNISFHEFHWNSNIADNQRITTTTATITMSGDKEFSRPWIVIVLQDDDPWNQRTAAIHHPSNSKSDESRKAEEKRRMRKSKEEWRRGMVLSRCNTWVPVSASKFKLYVGIGVVYHTFSLHLLWRVAEWRSFTVISWKRKWHLSTVILRLSATSENRRKIYFVKKWMSCAKRWKKGRKSWKEENENYRIITWWICVEYYRFSLSIVVRCVRDGQATAFPFSGIRSTFSHTTTIWPQNFAIFSMIFCLKFGNYGKIRFRNWKIFFNWKKNMRIKDNWKYKERWEWKGTWERE